MIINGEQVSGAAGKTLAEYLAEVGYRTERIVVERNGSIVRREDYPQTILEEEDELEILSFVGGG